MSYDKFIRCSCFIICLFCLLFSIIYSKGSEKTEKNDRITTKIDTVFVKDTVIFYKPKPTYTTQVDTVVDTLRLANDTVKVAVEVPIETKEYKDSLYYCRISGFQPILEHLEIYPTQTTITKEITQYRAKKWNYGVQMGVGYGLINKKPDLYLGIGVTYNIK